MKPKTYKTSRRWKYIVLRDDDGNEIKKAELDENQKLKCPRIRNKKRKLNHQLKASTITDNKSSENDGNETEILNNFTFREENSFNHELQSDNYFSVGGNLDLSIEPNTNFNFEILDDDEEYFRKTDSENIFSGFQDNFFLSGIENIDGMLL